MVKPMHYPPPLVLIEWLDSKGVTSEWEHLDGLKPLLPSVCLSIGFLIDDHKDYKTLAQSLNRAKDNA